MLMPKSFLPHLINFQIEDNLVLAPRKRPMGKIQYTIRSQWVMEISSYRNCSKQAFQTSQDASCPQLKSED